MGSVQKGTALRHRVHTPDGDRLLHAIGRQITYLRQQVGISQADLARRCHISRFQMCKHEGGSAEMPITRFYQICAVLKVSGEEFCHRIPKFMGNGHG